MESKKDIYEKYKKYEHKYHELIKKRLQKSIYPTQGNDFYFLTIPKGSPNAGREVTVDYQLKNLVLYFWDYGLITMGWDQGWESYYCSDCFRVGFISFTNTYSNNKSTISFLKNHLTNIFGKDTIRTINNRKLIWAAGEGEKGLKKYLKQEKIFFIKNPKKILIDMQPTSVAIKFRNGLLPVIHKKMGIEMPRHEDSCPGGLIIYDPKN